MKVNSVVTMLNCLAHDKKDSKDKYYTLSVLDDSDVSWQFFVSRELFDKITQVEKLKRFDEISVDLNMFKAKDGQGYSFTVRDVSKIPFGKK